MDELYIAARHALLDALDALGIHRQAIILVGAQAVYLHTGEADLAIAPYTTDGDLAIDPSVLKETPTLEKSLSEAGFVRKSKNSVGEWQIQCSIKQNPALLVTIDLLVPESVSPGKGRRAAHLRGHDANVARIVKGLEGVLIDNDKRKLAALDHTDRRTFEIRVAGPASLLIAKTYKINDRSGSGRESDKDALDVLRLLRKVSIEEFKFRFEKLLVDERSTDTTKTGLQFLRNQFGSQVGTGSQMAARATKGIVNTDEITLSCELLTYELLDALAL